MASAARSGGGTGSSRTFPRFKSWQAARRGSVEEGPNETRRGAAAGQNQPLYAGSALNPWPIACYTWLKPQKMGAHMDWRLTAAVGSAGGSLCLGAGGGPCGVNA